MSSGLARTWTSCYRSIKEKYFGLLSCLSYYLASSQSSPSLTGRFIIIYACLYYCSNIPFRVATFNDCEDAAKELQRQIGEAREDLRSKGFNFEDKPEKKTD